MEKMFTVEELKGKKLVTLEKLLLEHRNISIINFDTLFLKAPTKS